ncbi:MAG: hypothetical protein RHS_0196 [Robinsoniella sp. RHS]|nr:MAG: hypothetical protein RHS_0196 [Robinsoniella sp. RHS]
MRQEAVDDVLSAAFCLGKYFRIEGGLRRPSFCGQKYERMELRAE